MHDGVKPCMLFVEVVQSHAHNKFALLIQLHAGQAEGGLARQVHKII